MQAKKKKKPVRLSNAQLAARIFRVAKSMKRLGCEMEYFGGFGEIGDHGREMIGAAVIARGWALALSAKNSHLPCC